MPNRLLSKRATKNDLFLCFGIFVITFLGSGILLPKVLYQISQGCNAILKIFGGFGIFLPILPAIASVVISRIIFRTETADLPFFVRFMKSGLFWFVLSAVGILIVFPKAVLTKEDIPRIIYLILLADFCTLFIKTWTFISPKSKIPTRAM